MKKSNGFFLAGLILDNCPWTAFKLFWTQRTTTAKCYLKCDPCKWKILYFLLVPIRTKCYLLATAGLISQIVSFFCPQILMTLPFGPRPRASARFQIGQDSLLPLVETFAMHVSTDGAEFIVTSYLKQFTFYQYTQGRRKTILITRY